MNESVKELYDKQETMNRHFNRFHIIANTENPNKEYFTGTLLKRGFEMFKQISDEFNGNYLKRIFIIEVPLGSLRSNNDGSFSTVGDFEVHELTPSYLAELGTMFTYKDMIQLFMDFATMRERERVLLKIGGNNYG